MAMELMARETLKDAMAIDHFAIDVVTDESTLAVLPIDVWLIDAPVGVPSFAPACFGFEDDAEAQA
jgi:hypothetical protein